MKKSMVCWVIIIALLVGSITASSAQTVDSLIQRVEDTVQFVNTPSLQDEFDPNYVIVTIKNQYSEINKNWKPDDFIPLEISMVTDLRPVPTDRVAEYQSRTKFRSILRLTLSNPGYQNVLDAIETLLAQEIVYAAEPDYTSVQQDSTEPDDPMYST